MNDLGSRYKFFKSTKAGKQFIGQVIVTVGILLNLMSIFLEANPRVEPHVVHGLNGFGVGLVLVGIVMVFMNRKDSR